MTAKPGHTFGWVGRQPRPSMERGVSVRDEDAAEPLQGLGHADCGIEDARHDHHRECPLHDDLFLVANGVPHETPKHAQ